MRERIRVRVKPDQGLIGWMHRYALKNHWRVAHWIEFDDLIQDGYMLYYKLRGKYPGVVENRHMMSLFQRTFANHLTDLANKRTGLGETEVTGDDDSDESWLDRLAVDPDSLPEMAVLIAEAPPELRAFLSLFDNPRGRKLLQEPHRWVNGARETTNQRICRLLRTVGIRINPSKRDVAGDFKEYLKAA